MDENTSINYFGLTSFRNEKKKFGIKIDDRRRHFYVVGKTGMGKSNMMENMAIQDIQAGRGIAYIDPHGEGAEKLLNFVPSNRINDVIYFNPSDLDYPIAFNVMEKVDFKLRHLVASGLMGVFKKVWPDVWSARMEYILNNSILALLEYPDATLLGVNRMLADPVYRAKVVAEVNDPIVKAFWNTEFARYTQKYEIEATAAIQNKVGQFISNPLIRNIIGQTKSTINMRDIMDQEKIFIINLSKGRIGEDNSRLLGALIITKIQLGAMSRVDIGEETRKDFYFYVDEFQNFATESFANILSEARKYRLNLILGHQYIGQLTSDNSTKMRDAVFGNVGTMAVFRVGAEDAEFLEKEFSPEFMATDLVNLGKYNIYLKLMIDGVASHPFSAETLPPPINPEESNTAKIIRASQERYGVKRDNIEEKIARWSSGADLVPLDIKRSVTINPKNQMPVKSGTPNTVNNFPDENQVTLHDAICSSCQKSTKVIFLPEVGRKIYCKSCLKKMKVKPAETQTKNQLSKKNELPVIINKPEAPSKIVIENIATEVKPKIVRDPIIITDVDKEKKITNTEDKIKNVSFSSLNKKNESYSNSNFYIKPKKKEIDLSELRKVLEESLKENKDTSEDVEDIDLVDSKIQNIGTKDNKETKLEFTKEPESQNLPIENPDEELKNRIAEEKMLDEIRNNEPDDDFFISKKAEVKKGVIIPGQKVKL